MKVKRKRVNISWQNQDIQVGDILVVHGWVMLKNLDSGSYVVTRLFTKKNGEICVVYRKKRGRQEYAHYLTDIVLACDDKNLNHIKVYRNLSAEVK